MPLLYSLHYFFPGENELYVAGGDGCAVSVYKWCGDEHVFEEMGSLDVPRKQ